MSGKPENTSDKLPEKEIQPYKIQNSNEWNAAREGALQSTSLENADEAAEIKKRKQDSKKSKEAEEKATKEAEESVDDISDLFPELEIVFIGKHSFDNEQIIKNFGPVDGFADEHLVALLKKVFQNKYPITRSHGLPKIPSKDNDKKLLLKALYNYFNNLRREIIKKRKQQGNSMMLRESIGHLEEIKMLIEHFEQDKAKFPYHLFREYMNNADYYSNEGDMHEQLIKIRTKKHGEEHVRNLLRQFAKIYLLNQGKDNITVGGPGVTKEDFEEFIKSNPNISSTTVMHLIELLGANIDELEGKGDIVDYSSLMDLLKALDAKFNKINEDTPEQSDGFSSTTGGGDKTQDSEKAVSALVDKIIDAYQQLKTREKELIAEKITLSNKWKEAYERNIKVKDESNEEWKKAYERNLGEKGESHKKWEESQKVWQTHAEKLEKELTALKSKVVEFKNEKGNLLTDASGNPIDAVEYGNKWKEAYERNIGVRDKSHDEWKEAYEKLQLEKNELKNKFIKENLDLFHVFFDSDNNNIRNNEINNIIRIAGESDPDLSREFEKYITGKVNAYKLFGLIDEGQTIEDINKYYKKDTSTDDTIPAQIKKIMAKHANEKLYIDAKQIIMNDLKITNKQVEAAVLEETQEEVKEENLLNAYKLFGFLDETNLNGTPYKFENIRKYYTRKSSNANKNIRKVDNDEITLMIKRINSVMADHTNNENYIAAKKLIIDDLNITQEEIAAAAETTQGGARKLLHYSKKVADNRLSEFLIEEPLPFASLITDFEKSSNLSIVRETNEKHILEEFVVYQLRNYFKDEKMKEFFYEFNNLFEKMKFHEMINMCFSLYEICNAISKSDENIDVVRLESNEYTSLLDQIQNLLKSCNFDFYEVASKEMLNVKLIDIKYHENHIYFKPDTKSFEHTYSIDNTLNLTMKSYDYNEDIYTINNKVLYFFFILSAYNLVRKDIKDREIVQSLLKNTRTLKRNYKKSAKVRWQTK